MGISSLFLSSWFELFGVEQEMAGEYLLTEQSNQDIFINCQINFVKY